MKAMMTIFSVLVMTSSSWAVTYEVPVSEELKQYAAFELTDFDYKLVGSKIILDYKLPKILVGNETRIQIETELRAENDEKGENVEQAECIGDVSVFTCTIKYDARLKIDQRAAIKAIREISGSRTEALGRIKVMRAFSTEPVGIVKY